MTQKLKALFILAENLSSVPSTHIYIITACNASQEEPSHSQTS